MSVMRTLTLNGVTYRVESAIPATTTITLKADGWLGDASPYAQVVPLVDVTSMTKVDLQPTVDQLHMLHSHPVGFCAVNDNGVVTVYAVGNKPTDDFTFQVTLTEVEA